MASLSVRQQWVLGVVLVLCVSAAPVDAHAASAHDDALGYWSFNDGTADDATGNGYDGVVSGATWTAAGKVGGAYSFDGANHYIRVPNSGPTDMFPTIASNDSFSIALWAKALPQDNIEQWVYHYTVLVDRWASPEFILYHAKNPDPFGDPSFLGAMAGGSPYLSYELTLEEFGDDIWHHYVLTYDRSLEENQLRLFIDTVQVDQVDMATPNDLPLNTSSLTFGARNESFGEGVSPYKGLLDEVALWDRALSEEEIGELFNEGNGVPEPATILSLLCAAAIAARRIRKRKTG